MIGICILLIAAEVVRYLEMRELIRLLPLKKELPPPKARTSFVVKRMEERLKEAMYPKDSAH